MKNYLKIFKALGDRSRLRIVIMLLVKPMCVCEIREIIGTSMSTVSNHLRILKEADLINFQKEEKYINYELNITNNLVQEVLNILKDIDDKIITDDHQKAVKADRSNLC